jgi:phospholipid transport system substrate-binding protein
MEDVVVGSFVIRGFLLPVLLLPVVSLSGLARAAPSPDIVAPIQQLYNAVQDVMKAGVATPFLRRFGIIAPAIDQAFDLSAILQIAIGTRWASLSSEQRAGLLEAFRCFTVAEYVARFDSYSGQRFTILPDRRSIGIDEQVLRTQITPASGEPHNLDYVMRQIGGHWKAVDVLVDGAVSQVATQRSDFRRTLAEGGAQALLGSLWQKTANLCSGEGCVRSLEPRCRR